MRVIDAYWEKRNLNKKVIEINCDIHDNLDELDKVIDNIDAEYSVIKIPSNRSDLLILSQNKGYIFIETSIALECNLNEIKYNTQWIDNCIHFIKEYI